LTFDHLMVSGNVKRRLKRQVSRSVVEEYGLVDGSSLKKFNLAFISYAFDLVIVRQANMLADFTTKERTS
jgi:hypothetical protein